MAIADYKTVGDPGTISAILKDFYIGPLQEQLNNEVMCLEMFEKAKVSWAGRQAIVPIHVSRNTGVAYASEATAGGTNLPTAGTQGVARLSIEASYLYGRMAVTGQAVSAAKQGGTASFIGTLDLEMEKLKDDIRDRANEACVTGGEIVGLTGHVSNAALGATVTINVDGNLKKLKTLAAAGNVSLAFISATPEDLGAGGYKFVNGTLGTAASSLLQITSAADVNTTAGTVRGTVLTGDINFPLVPDGFVTAVKIFSYTAAGVYDPAKEPVGILGNLFSDSHFGVSRITGATDAEKTLQSVGLAADADGSGDGREALALDRMQEMMDSVGIQSGQDPDLILCNKAMRAKYIALLNGNVQLDPKSAATTVDGGVTGINFNGIPIRTSRHVPQGMFIFLNTSTFKLAILEDGKFADMDGNVLSRVSNADAFEGFYKWYYNHYCYRPNASGVLAGVIGGTQTA
jgi:hypothetical protein